MIFPLFSKLKRLSTEHSLYLQSTLICRKLAWELISFPILLHIQLEVMMCLTLSLHCSTKGNCAPKWNIKSLCAVQPKQGFAMYGCHSDFSLMLHEPYGTCRVILLIPFNHEDTTLNVCCQIGTICNVVKPPNRNLVHRKLQIYCICWGINFQINMLQNATIMRLISAHPDQALPVCLIWELWQLCVLV